MEHADITLALKTDDDLPTTMIEKTITPAEKRVLDSIHGNNCIRNIRMRKNTKKEDKKTMFDEYHRLVHFYNLDKLQKIWPQISEDNIPFSETFKDIGVTKEYIRKSNRGIGALPNPKPTAEVLDECINAGLLTNEIIVKFIDKLTGKKRKAILAELERNDELGKL